MAKGSMRRPAGDGLAGVEPADDALGGIALLLLSLCLFSCSDTLGKILTAGLPPLEIIWIRYLVFVPLLLLLVAARPRAALASAQPGWQCLRGAGVLGSSALFLAGLKFMPLAENTALGFASPLFITILSIFVLGETVGPRRWAAVALGFAGVVVVARPGTSAFSLAALLPLSNAFCWAAAMTVTRRMGQAEAVLATLVYSAGTGLAIVSLLVPAVWRMPTPDQWALGALTGLVNALAQFIVLLAYRRARASLLAQFSYLQIVTSATLGYFVFHAAPALTTWIGGGMIVASGIYTAHRERLAARRRGAAPPDAVPAAL